MKKVLSFLIVLVILCAVLAVPASAAGSGSVSMGSAGGNRGDTVTLYVNLNSNPGLVTMTIKVSYDTSVLQLTNVSDTGLLVGAQLSTSYGSPYTISWVDGATTTNNTKTGTIAAFTFKILDNAQFGDSIVKLQFVDSYDTDYQENSFSASSGKVTVQCNHSYSIWCDGGAGEHRRICTICAAKESEKHTWDSGNITKEPTCKENGTRIFTCTACNTTGISQIAKTTDHKYGSWTTVNDTTHKHICTVCAQEETASHSWNSGVVTKKPTCKEAGVTTYTCTGCKTTKTEAIAKTDAHTYGPWRAGNDAGHTHICTVCSQEETADHSWNSGVVTKKPTCKEAGVKTFTCTACNAVRTETVAKLTDHTYDHTCDTDCNVCGTTRTVTHHYKSMWSKDQTNHWHECSVCKDKKDVAAHTPGAEATEKTPQTCTTCGYILQAVLGHQHQFSAKWTEDEKGHWHTCSGCEEKDSYTTHRFENTCDPDCSVCGYTREIAHQFAETWTADEENHWLVCDHCGLRQGEAVHEPGAEATATTAQSCTICGYEITPALGVEETTEPTAPTESTTPPTPLENATTSTPLENATTPNPTTPVEQNNSNDNGFPVWIVIVPVVVIAGVVVVVATKKKKS